MIFPVNERHMSSGRGQGSGRWVRLSALVVLLAGLGLAGWFLSAQARAWSHLSAGRAALERGESNQAREHLDICLRAWPRSGEVHFLAARAARRCGELEEASEHLDRAAEYGWDGVAIDLERALWRVQARELPAVEDYLVRCLDLHHPDSLLILEILTPAYLRNFQLDQARACVERWLELAPESAAAWHARGVLAELKQGRTITVESFAEAVRLDPGRRDSRLALARALLNCNRPADARPHLEEVLRQDPDNAEARVKLAACLKGLGKADEARRLLDDVLQQRPEDAEALHQRGKIELETGDSKKAAVYLRRAVERAPFDRELLYTWQRCLQRPEVGAAKEAEDWKKRLDAVEADMRLLANLTAKILGEPRNPDLRCGAGEVLLRNGQEEDGLRWMNSALAIQPDHAATHRALAGYYEKKGNAPLAERHRIAGLAAGKP
jgi:Tfp pilus assembly protein PilF